MPDVKKSIIVVDLGGTKILSAVLDKQAKVIATSKKSTKSSTKKNSIFERIIKTIENSLSNANLTVNDVDGIVIGVPGSLNPETGIVYLAPNLGWKNLNVVEPIQNYFNKLVLIENDANLGALGIYNFERKDTCKNLIAIFVGTGIGAGIVIDGRLYHGKNFSAGEIGHMIINEKGYKCGCGNFGCLETEASRLAITRMINEQIKNGKRSVVTKLTNDLKVIKSSIIAEAVRRKDKVVISAIKYSAEKLGISTGNLINLLDIDCIVFAGGVMEAVGKFMLPLIKEKVKQTALKSNLRNTKIVLSTLKDDAAIYGGFALFKNY